MLKHMHHRCRRFDCVALGFGLPGAGSSCSVQLAVCRFGFHKSIHEVEKELYSIASRGCKVFVW